MVPLSILDLSPIVEGGTAAGALRNSIDLARHAERLGYRRYWIAEHHNMAGVATAATAVVIGQIAAATSSIRVGAGGIMLPNHAPLVVAEQFGTLEALFPGRIDLGLGRAPGTDGATVRALRRDIDPAAAADRFPEDVAELLGYFRPGRPGQPVVAVPGAGLEVPVWILGSSLFGAQLAAAMGLPYAFASHFAPAELSEAVALYRARFRPGPSGAGPRVMLGVNVVAAATDEEAGLLLTSLQQAFVNLRRGRPGPLPPPLEGFEDHILPIERALLDAALECSVFGSLATVRAGLEAFADRTGADELILSTHVHDPAARRRSLELTAEAFGQV
jgi:luciferase family oxidoreductase group 1